MNEEATIWNSSHSFADLARQAQDADELDDLAALCAVPRDLLDRAINATLSADLTEARAGSEFIMSLARPRVQKAGDLRAALLFKEIAEVCAGHRNDMAWEAANELQYLFRSRFEERMGDEGISKTALEENPMGAIEECFFGQQCGRDDHLVGAYWLTVYRVLTLVHDGNSLAQTLFALREAYAYYMAGESMAADAASNWAFRNLQDKPESLITEQQDAVGQFVQAVATAAEQVNDAAAQEHYLKAAIKHSPEGGNTRAECWLELSLLYEKQQRYAEALRACAEGRRTPNVTERDVLGMLETQWSSLRAMLEGSPEKIKLDARVVETLGLPSEVDTALRDILVKTSEGAQVTDRELAQAIRKLREACAFMRSNGIAEQKVLSQYLLMLGFALTMADPNDVDCSPRDLLAEAETLTEVADEGQRLRLEQFRELLGRWNT